MRAWVTKETVVDGKRKRAKCGLGVRGVGDADRFAVEFIDPSGKRSREKVGIVGKPGKRAADRRADQVTGEILTGMFEAQNRATWAEFRKKYESKMLRRLEATAVKETRNAMNHYEAIIRPNRVAMIATATIDAYATARPEQRGKKRDSKVSAHTVRKELRHPRAVLNVAKDWKLLAETPKFRMPRVLQRKFQPGDVE